MKIYHLSHTDLDGYACQYVLSTYFKDCAFFNSNYGREINENFYLIMDQIHKDFESGAIKKAFILISDLNLSLAQCEEFSQLVKDKNIKLLLIDHHQSGLECALKYEWYLLDERSCATKLVYTFFSRLFKEDAALERFVSVVNAIDIWLKEEKEFELGKVFLMMVATAKEINRVMFSEQNTQFIFYLLTQARTFIDKDKAHIALDDALHFLKKEFFKKDENNTLGNLVSNYVVQKLSENKERFSIEFEGFKGLLSYNIGNTSVIGNDFLTQNPEFDFFLDVSPRKTLSFRANNKIDVSLMAKKLVGGGGHKNASGGLFAGFKDSFNYEFVKAQICDLITLKTRSEHAK